MQYGSLYYINVFVDGSKKKKIKILYYESLC